MGRASDGLRLWDPLSCVPTVSACVRAYAGRGRGTESICVTVALSVSLVWNPMEDCSGVLGIFAYSHSKNCEHVAGGGGYSGE